ncbi:unnamed protein product [Moneuplotes crassus]|uniref:UDENN domain-containing protein n=1 Tax=Euplotes crassus TaxID=5936 RepID=A0AAD1X6F8_EUPCR|nr:unnamed protein product [Moneuplotes crassus]
MLESMLKLFCATCTHKQAGTEIKAPLISIFANKLSQKSPGSDLNQGILLFLIREYENRFNNQKEVEDFRRSNCSSMPIESKESRLKSISFPLYPDNINHTIIVYNYVPRNCLVNLFFALLLQTKIIIVTEKVGRAALIIESLFKLIYPFDSSCYTTIGDVQEGLAELAGAPFPVIIGCSPSKFYSLPNYEVANVKEECMICNIDTEEITWLNEISFPKSQSDYLNEKLNELQEEVLTNKDFRLDGYLDLTDESDKSVKLQVMVILEYNMKIKKIFINVMILLLSNYQEFWNQVDGEFEYARYIKLFNKQSYDFYSNFVKTQLFHTFLQDSDEEKTMEIKEFLSYYSLLKSTNKANSTIKYASFGRKVSDEQTPSESESMSDELSQICHKTMKMKPLTFKQNMEILNLLEAFDEDSDCDSQFDDDQNESSIQVNFLDQDYEKKTQTPEKYQSSKKLPRVENQSQALIFGQSLKLMPGRKRCDSGKLDAKGSRFIARDYIALSSEERSPIQVKSGNMTERTSFEKKTKELTNFFGIKNKKKDSKKTIKAKKSKNKGKANQSRGSAKSLKNSGRKTMNPDSVVLYDLSKHFCLSSVPTVEVNVVSSERGDDNLSITSRSVEKIPMKSVPHYRSIGCDLKVNRSILDQNKSNGGRLRWSNHKHGSPNTESLSEDEASEGIIKNNEILSTNKPYESSLNTKPQMEEVKPENEKHLAQSIPVLNLKTKQIPHLEHMASYSPPREEHLIPNSLKNTLSIDIPVDRKKKFTLRKDCNSDSGLHKMINSSKILEQKGNKSYQPMKNFRMKNIKKYGKQFSSSPNTKISIETRSGRNKKTIKQYTQKMPKIRPEEYSETTKNSSNNLMIRKSLLCHQKTYKNSYYNAQNKQNKTIQLMKNKDSSPSLKIPRSPHCFKVRSNKIMTFEKKVAKDVNCSYDQSLYKNGRLNFHVKKNSSKPVALTKGNCSESQKKAPPKLL